MISSSKPTLFQSLFNQPSQKYAPHHRTRAARRPRHPTPLSSSSSSSSSTLFSSPEAPNLRMAGPDVASVKLARPSDTDMVGTSCEQVPDSASPTDSDTDVFYTPLSSPRSSILVDQDVDKPPAAMSNSSVSTHDDLFSWRSATTSATSLSDTLPSQRPRTAPHLARPRSKPRSKSTSVAEWSKDVRWLVPPDKALSSHTSSVAGSLLDLVDVEYDTPPKEKLRIKAGRRSRPTTSDRRMSALVEEEEDDEHPPTSHSVQTAPVLGAAPPHAFPQRARTISAPGTSRRLRPPSMLSSASSASRTVVLPTPLPVSSGATSASTGYTSLTLPRAAYAPSKNPGRVSSAVDITRSGLAQTTMSSISITRHAAASSLRFAVRTKSDTPARLQAALPSPLGFSSHTSPPNKVSSGQVLVQVWAVALDGLDALLVDERAGKSDGFGYVPGRSFVGRVIECGWEVNSVAKGDWVVGITDVRKSGALSEFILVDKRRLHRAPRPSHALTIDQLALLPLAGVPSHRAVRTLAHLPRSARALVLHAHTGAGLLATQELAALGFRVTAHVAGAWGGAEERRAREAGAGDVRCGRAVEVVRDVGRDAFDGVVDTLGGRDVWDACRKVLRTSGQFTTLVGDSDADIPSANAHFKSNMRSLRRAFVKDVGYQWVSPAADVDGEGEDVRDSLAAVVRLAEEGVLHPWAGHALPFERAPEAFAGALGMGGTAVVRIVD